MPRLPRRLPALAAHSAAALARRLAAVPSVDSAAVESS
jgi:hypothetical protein